MTSNKYPPKKRFGKIKKKSIRGEDSFVEIWFKRYDARCVCVCVYIQVVKREIQTRPSAMQEMLSIQDVELNLFSFFSPLLL
jgi:hypothetical protein